MVSPAVTERARDVLALLGERMGDAARGLVDLFGHQLADLRDVAAEIEMDAVDGLADLLGLSDQGVALLAEVLQERADAHLVVVVGVFERGHLVGDQRLELGGARERALDAVAHGGDLAADRLADRDDRFARHRLGLGEPHRDLGHRLGDQPQLLRAPRHVRKHVEEHDRREEDRGKRGEDRCAHAARAERRLQVGKIQPAEQDAGQHPDDGEHGGDKVGRAGRAALDRAQDLADRFPVVIGRAAHAADILGAAHFVVECRIPRGGTRSSAPRRLGRRLIRKMVRRRRRRRRGSRRFGRRLGIPNIQRVLDRRQRRLCRILHLLRSVRHVGRRLVLRSTSTRRDTPQTVPRAREPRDPLWIPLQCGPTSPAPRGPCTAARLSYRLGRPKKTGC